MNKKMSFIISLMLGIFLLMPSVSFAIEKNDSIFDRINHTNEIAMIEDFEIPIVIPFSSHLTIDSESIDSSGTSWKQPKGYKSYRVWVQNDTNEKMTVTIRFSTGWWSTDTHTLTVPANSGKSLTVNNAESGEHKISFTTSSGYLSGTVSVRVSDETL